MRTLVPAGLALSALACATIGAAVQDGRRPLDHDAYERWRTIEDTELSSTGRWILYSLEPDGGDAELFVHSPDSGAQHTIPRGKSGRFDRAEGFAVCRIEPEREAVRAAKKAKKKKDELPVEALGILNLADGEVEVVERVRSFEMPKERGGWVAWLHHEQVESKKDKEKKDEKEAGTEEEQEQKQPEQPAEEEQEADKKDEKKKKDKKDGTELVLRDLTTHVERRFAHVVSYAFSEDGRWLAYATQTKDGSDDGVHLVAVDDPAGDRALATGEGRYQDLAFDEPSRRLAFLTNRDDWEADEPEWSLYLWREGQSEPRLVARSGTAGVPSGWGVGPHRAPSFSESGRRLYFGTAPLPEPEPEELPEDEQVEVDVWSWSDDLLQPMQLVQLEREQERTYLAVAHLDEYGSARVVQLANREYQGVDVPEKGEADVGLASSDLPYRRMMSWDTQTFQDVALVDVATGARTVVLERERGNFELSPGGRFVTWWDPERLAWFAIQVAGGRGRPVDLTAEIPYPVHDELHDTPSLPRSYGAAGWLADDAGFLLYDKHDVWLVDPATGREPRCLTEGAGRREDVRLRWIDLDREEEAIDPAEPLLFSAFSLSTKDAGFWRDGVQGERKPEELVMMPRRFSRPVKAEEGDVLRFTRESFTEFPDVWVSDLDLGNARRVSEANPQQSEYRWGTAELVEWTSTDGEALEGILYKPEGFDPSLEYPLIAYFYERRSDNLHAHHDPIPSRSTVKYSFYTSRGYLVFVPDIPYTVGWPGESALHAVVPGILKLVGDGFVDEHAIGIQGHSWGGYQVAYMVTQSPLFAAAVSGAPVSNMTSAYGGIRWSSGMSRMFQYEKTQSRIGGTLWDELHRYIDNSPVFYADKVETPLLIMHNDDDGAVPWYQGIELFVALRRLDKPAWMLNYNGENHTLRKFAHKRDYAIRMQQFFDHYLKGAPAAAWMVEGVPAIRKGRALGLELAGEEVQPVGAGHVEASSGD